MEWKLNWMGRILFLLLTLLRGRSVDGFIGVVWGRFATQSMVASVVVDLLLQNEIPEIRLYAPSPHVLRALKDSSLGITVTLPSDFIKRVKYSNLKNVCNWTSELIGVPVSQGVDIKTLVVLDEPFSTFGERVPVWNATEVFEEASDCLREQNLTNIKTTTAHLTDVLKNVSKPSEADFRDDIKDKMLKYLSMFHKADSFFLYNLHPIFSAQENNWPIEFAFMDNKSNFTIVDGKYTYRNAFEFMYDAMVVAIEKAGYPHMEIVIGQIGWPTDGAEDASVENAERFYRSFLTYIAQKKGTPRRPNKNIDVYLAALTDENKVPLEMGAYQRRRGIYNYDGKPKFKIDFTGRGRDMYPVEAQGVMKMPARWCVLKVDSDTNMTLVDQQMEIACAAADCSSLLPGASCDNLNHTMNVSYAFNMYYQSNNQGALTEACNFEGMAALTPDDPSVGTCEFPIEILTAETVDGGLQTKFSFYVGYNSAPAAPHISYISIALPWLLLLFLFTTHFSSKCSFFE